MNECQKIPVVLELFLGMGSDIALYTFEEFKEAAAVSNIDGIEEFIKDNFDDSEVFINAENNKAAKEYIEKYFTDNIIKKFVNEYRGDELVYGIAEIVVYENTQYVDFKNIRSMIKKLDN